MSTPEVLAPRNLPYQMFLLVQEMTRKFQLILNPYNITPLHWGVLCCLWAEDNLRTTEIAQRLDQLGGTLTVGLNAMETRKLIERRADPADARVSRIALTKKGRKLQAILEPEAAALIEHLFAPLNPTQYAELAQAIGKLRNSINPAPPAQATQSRSVPPPAGRNSVS